MTVTLRVGEQLALVFPSQSLVADRARLSQHVALREAMALMQGFLDATSALDDWQAACLVDDPAGRFDQDAAFASCWHFQNVIELPVADRPSHREFVKSLIAAGYPEGRSPDGRAFHNGARLVDKLGGGVMIAGVMPVGVFIAERCALGAEYRAPALDLHQNYAEFARSRGAEPLGAVAFSKELISLGFRRLRSDGHQYVGLALAKSGASNGRRSR